MTILAAEEVRRFGATLVSLYFHSSFEVQTRPIQVLRKCVSLSFTFLSKPELEVEGEMHGMLH